MARQFDDVMLGSIELFCLCAELQGFTAAATAAGLTPPAVSRSISRLEQRLGVKLFTRTTRSVRLTDGGRAYHAQCRRALDQLVEAEREVTGQQTVPAGSLRISVSTSYGHHRVLPLLPRFRRRYPQVSVEVDVSNHNIDFQNDGFDLAIRARTPPDSSLIARRLEDAALIVVASPAYLKRRGTPKTIEALTKHECIRFVLPRTGQPVPWLFQREGTDVEVAVSGAVTCTGDVLAVATLARAGGGIAQTFRMAVQDDLDRGSLKELLPAQSGARPFSILYPGNRHMPLRMRVFIDFMVEQTAPRMRSGKS